MLTRMEMNHRKFIWKNMQKTRSTPGYEKVYLVETAPQLGVRITRVLDGLKSVTLDDLKAGTQVSRRDRRGRGVRRRPQEWQIPYGALVPQEIDNVLAAGRCISAEMRMADLVRLIPNCLSPGTPPESPPPWRSRTVAAARRGGAQGPEDPQAAGGVLGLTSSQRLRAMAGAGRGFSWRPW